MCYYKSDGVDKRPEDPWRDPGPCDHGYKSTLGTHIHVLLQEQWGEKGILPVVTRALVN